MFSLTNNIYLMYTHPWYQVLYARYINTHVMLTQGLYWLYHHYKMPNREIFLFRKTIRSSINKYNFFMVTAWWTSCHIHHISPRTWLTCLNYTCSHNPWVLFSVVGVSCWMSPLASRAPGVCGGQAFLRSEFLVVVSSTSCCFTVYVVQG